MELTRQKILIDIDDTFLKSYCKCQSIIENNMQNKTNEMCASDKNFYNVFFNDGAIKFIDKYSKLFDIVFVSYGTEEDLYYKAEILTRVINTYDIDNVFLIACETDKANKSEILLDNVYVAIDSHTKHLEELNAPKKILLKNFQETDYNKTPINDEYTYIANSLDEIDKMIEFDLKLKDMGVWLDA